MNRELITQYKLEFDHWLNGESVLCTNWEEDNKLWRDTCPSGDDFTYTGNKPPKFVINDKYVEYRKALAEVHHHFISIPNPDSDIKL